MSRLQWSDDYSVGDAEIDQQHKALFNLIDRLEDHDMDETALSITLEKLECYVQEHFLAEEEILKSCHYPQFDAHLRQHDEFRDWLNMLRGNFSSQQEDSHIIGGNVHDFLRDWLLTHILTADQAYKTWIHR